MFHNNNVSVKIILIHRPCDRTRAGAYLGRKKIFLIGPGCTTEFENLNHELSNYVSQPMFLMVQAWLTNARIDQASRARKQVFTTPQSGGHFRTSYEDIHCARAAPQPPHRFIGALYVIRERSFFVTTHAASFRVELSSCLNKSFKGVNFKAQRNHGYFDRK